MKILPDCVAFALAGETVQSAPKIAADGGKVLTAFGRIPEFGRMSPKRLFVFEDYRLDERERQLLRGSQAVPLPPKLFDLLAELVENAGRLLPKQDLLDEVWPGVAVEEGSLTRGISSLRRVLGSTADGGDYIQTVAKRGYRHIANVRETTDDELERPRRAGPIP